LLALLLFSSLSALKNRSRGDASFRGISGFAKVASDESGDSLLSLSLSRRACMGDADASAGTDFDWKNLGTGSFEGAGEAWNVGPAYAIFAGVPFVA